MKRAHPIVLRTSMDMARVLVERGIDFVPMPILDAHDNGALVDQMADRLGRLALMAEAEAEQATRAPGAEPTNRDRIEAIGRTHVIIHQCLTALRQGAVPGYQEALELMVLALAQQNHSINVQLSKLLSTATMPMLTAPPPSSRYGTNSGHGHVWRRPDGEKAQCGGLRSCSVCASEIFEAERAVPGSVMDPAGEERDKTMATQFAGHEVVDVAEQQP